jgi:hypothetical protein
VGTGRGSHAPVHGAPLLIDLAHRMSQHSMPPRATPRTMS